jgi:putative transposase
VLLKREGWRINAKRIYRLNHEGLAVRTRPRKRLASHARVPVPTPTRPNEHRSMDFVSARLADGRWFRTLTIVDVYTREALALVADRSLAGVKVAATLTPLVHQRGRPAAIRVDNNGGDFVSRAMDTWAYAREVQLDFIRPGRPVENAFIESFNGRLRDECLNSHVFASVREAQTILDGWRADYNQVRPHSSLRDRTPAEVRLLWVGKTGRKPKRPQTHRRSGPKNPPLFHSAHRRSDGDPVPSVCDRSRGWPTVRGTRSHLPH